MIQFFETELLVTAHFADPGLDPELYVIEARACVFTQLSANSPVVSLAEDQEFSVDPMRAIKSVTLSTSYGWLLGAEGGLFGQRGGGVRVVKGSWRFERSDLETIEMRWRVMLRKARREAERK
jgi:hypothetical protein